MVQAAIQLQRAVRVAPADQAPQTHRQAEEILAKTPNGFMPQQFDNPANLKIHFETTGPEIWNDTDGRADILISGVGTGGTITGVCEYIKPKKPSFKAVAVEPADSPVLSGGKPSPHKIQGIGAGFVPNILRRDYIDEVVTVTNDNRIHWQKISVGRDFGTQLEVLNGLKENTEVVMNPTDDLREGIEVQVKGAEKPKPEGSVAQSGSNR